MTSILTILRRQLPHFAATACVFLAFISFAHNIHAQQPADIRDIAGAEEFCNNNALSPIEGIWLFPEDNVKVLIVKNGLKPSTSFPEYDIIVAETTDTSLHPGDLLGAISETAEKNKFELKLFTKTNKGKLSNPKGITAKINSNGDELTMNREKPKFRFRIALNPYTLLPNFWKLFRVSFGNSTSYSDDQPPVGMVKIYPSYDGNGSSRRHPRYL